MNAIQFANVLLVFFTNFKASFLYFEWLLLLLDFVHIFNIQDRIYNRESLNKGSLAE